MKCLITFLFPPFSLPNQRLWIQQQRDSDNGDGGAFPGILIDPVDDRLHRLLRVYDVRNTRQSYHNNRAGTM